jgi:hypothetical protein
MAILSFTAADVPADDRVFETLPVGTYLVQVIESDMLATRAGTGSFLKLTLEVLDGPYANRKLWDQINLENPNDDAVRFARRQLADLLLLLGIAHMEDSEELHFKPFYAQVGIRKDKSGQYPPQNTLRYRQPATAPGAPAGSPPRRAVTQAPRVGPQPGRPPTQSAPPPAPRPVTSPPQRPAPPPPPPPRNGPPKPWAQPRAVPPQDDGEEIPF